MHTSFNPQEMKVPSNWANEFGNVPPPPQSIQAPVPTSSFQRQDCESARLLHVYRPNTSDIDYQSSYMSSGMYGMRPMGTFPMSMDGPLMQSMDKGKGKSREMDFEAAFAQMAESLEAHPQQTARIEVLDDTADLAAAMARTNIEEAAAKANEQTTEDPELSSDFGR